MIERLVKLLNPPVIGSTYLVPTIDYNDNIWPVMGVAHSDPYIGKEAIPRHIHVDVRFADENAVAEEFNISIRYAYQWSHNQYFSKIFALTTPSSVEVIEREMVCLREIPILKHITKYPNGSNRYWVTGQSISHHADFEDRYEKRKLIGSCKVCPHHKIPLASMPISDGKIRCPGHLLDWSATDGTMIRRTEYVDGVAVHSSST